MSNITNTLDQSVVVPRSRLALRCGRAVAAGAGLSGLIASGSVFATPTPEEEIGAAVTGAGTDSVAFVVTYGIAAVLGVIAFRGLLGIGFSWARGIWSQLRGGSR
jgi:hypothetical protein